MLSTWILLGACILISYPNLTSKEKHWKISCGELLEQPIWRSLRAQWLKWDVYQKLLINEWNLRTQDTGLSDTSLDGRNVTCCSITYVNVSTNTSWKQGKPHFNYDEDYKEKIDAKDCNNEGSN